MSAISIPDLSLVVLIGASGSGKSTFASRHFRPTEILSSDFCRAIVSDDENDQSATQVAFEVLHMIADKRLAGGKITVVDATNVQAEARRPLISLARRNHCLPVAIVFDLPEGVCQQRNRDRADRNLAPHVIRRQHRDMRRSIRNLRREGFRSIFVLSSPEEVATATVQRERLWTNRAHEHGPFDIIGDVHGCFDELVELLGRLGYTVQTDTTERDESRFIVCPPRGRRVIFLGDLVDRGPRVPDTLRLAMDMSDAGVALCIPGNHDVKLLRKLSGRNVQLTHGLAESLEQLEREPAPFLNRVRGFLDSLISHYVLDDGALVVAHAGMTQELQGRSSSKVRDFALYGATTGEMDEFDLPVRLAWANEYRGRALVVYGHTPVAVPEWLNNTINIDTGCQY